jgi:ATP-binding cassette subfamily B multidrug efflux pump
MYVTDMITWEYLKSVNPKAQATVPGGVLSGNPAPRMAQRAIHLQPLSAPDHFDHWQRIIEHGILNILPMKHLLRLRRFMRPYFWQISADLSVLLIVTGLGLIVPLILQNVIDDGLLRGNITYLGRAALMLLGLGLIIALLNLAELYLSGWTAARIGYDIRNAMYNRIQYLPFTYYDHTQTGQLISRCIEDVRSIQNFIGDSVIQLVQLLFMAVGVIGVMVSLNLTLAMISLLPLIPMIMMTTDFGDRVTKLFYDVDFTLGNLSSRLQENVTGVQVVRAFAREPYEIDRFDEINKQYFDSRIKVMSEWSKVMPTTTLLVTIGTILILLFGGQMVLQGRMTVGEVVAFNAYMLMLSAPVQQIAWLVNGMGEAEAGAQRVLEILEHEPEIQSPAGAAKLSTLRGQVEFHHVSLCYADEKSVALKDIHLTVEPNQLVALIGQTGSGKTSLINLIPRFYDVSRGAVLVDGIDVRSVGLVSLRRQIGIVLQTSLLFSDSIKANIAYGRPDADEGEIIAAAKAAQAHEFIESFADGYETMVGERGVTLSGGQRQRVAIARALLMDPRILILDDSTSSVDTQTEKLIQEALDRLMEGRTTFVIAHRLATVRRADLILVMEDGQIVQRGKHDELVAQGGLYKEIHDLQLSQNKAFEDSDEKETEVEVEGTKISADHSLS